MHFQLRNCTLYDKSNQNKKKIWLDLLKVSLLHCAIDMYIIYILYCRYRYIYKFLAMFQNNKKKIALILKESLSSLNK